MTRVFLFDADGVVIRPPEFGTKAILEQAGLDTAWIFPFFTGETLFKQCLRGNKDVKDTIAPYLEECGWKGGVDMFVEQWFAYEHHLDRDLLAFIEELRKKGHYCMLVTEQEPYRKEYLLKDMGLADQFDGFSFSCDVGYLKDEKERYEHIYKDMLSRYPEIEKNDICVIDDSARYIDTAKAFGFDAVLHEHTKKTVDEIHTRIER